MSLLDSLANSEKLHIDKLDIGWHHNRRILIHIHCENLYKR